MTIGRVTRSIADASTPPSVGVVMRQDKILSKGIGEMLRLLRGAVYRLKQCHAVLAGTVMCWLIPAAWYQPGASIAGTRSCPDDDTGANRRVDKASKEEDKADKQYDTGHATVKSMSFTHTGCLTHKRFLEVYPQLGR